jgi:SAM-dependent methyltransferase
MSETMPGDTVALISTASGVVLDIGPGTGELLHCLKPDQITMVYGPEPAVDMHLALQANIEKVGMEDKYEILSSGAESSTLIPALAKKGVIKLDEGGGEGIFDTIMCIRVLCGVPDQEETIKELYRLLKPGGRLLVCEHIAYPWPKRGNLVGMIMQKVYVLAGWSFWIGGCHLNRDTETVLRRAGGKDGWKKFDLTPISSWHPIPFVVGELVKQD